MPDKKNLLLAGQKLQFEVEGKKDKILNVNKIQLYSGHCTFIAGENGAGKSTLLSVLAGAAAPTQGTLIWKGKPLQPVAERLLPYFDGIALVTQKTSLHPFWTVEDLLRKALRHLPDYEATKRKSELCKSFYLGHLQNQKAGDLSGGEARRLAIALALESHAELLMLDEPFAELDYENRTLLLHLLLKIKVEKKVGLVVVSHHGEDALWLADTLLWLSKGKIRHSTERTASGFDCRYRQVASLLGYKNLVQVSHTPIAHLHKNENWMRVPESALSVTPFEKGFAWDGFRCVQAFQSEAGGCSLWTNGSIHLYSTITGVPDPQTAIPLYVNISALIFLQ